MNVVNSLLSDTMQLETPIICRQNQKGAKHTPRRARDEKGARIWKKT